MAELLMSTSAGCVLVKGLPALGRSKFSAICPCASSPSTRAARIICSSEQKSEAKKYRPNVVSLMTVATTLAASPAIALVDERLSGEGTGLSLGVSNPLLVWILLGVSALIWSLYFTFASTLPEGDDESGLSL